MTRLHELYDDQGQSPWIDNLTRTGLRSGHLQQLVDGGIRGVTSNPTIFQKAIAGSADYDEQFATLLRAGSVDEAYWTLVIDDITAALDVMLPVHEASGGVDGYVSLEGAPALAHDTAASVEAAREFAHRIGRPNLMVKIPGTAAGIPAVRAMIAEGVSINVTLIFSLPRYAEVIEAYLAGLEARDGDLSTIASVASFFISRVDTEIDRRLEAVGTPEALALRGLAAVAQAKVAYDLFRQRFSGARWEALAARGAKVQRPLWASTSTKNPAYADLLYVDTLIGSDTVNTMPDATVDAFLDHGTVARTIDDGVDDAKAVLDRIEAVGVSLSDVSATLACEPAMSGSGQRATSLPIDWAGSTSPSTSAAAGRRPRCRPGRARSSTRRSCCSAWGARPSVPRCSGPAPGAIASSCSTPPTRARSPRSSSTTRSSSCRRSRAAPSRCRPCWPTRGRRCPMGADTPPSPIRARRLRPWRPSAASRSHS